MGLRHITESHRHVQQLTSRSFPARLAGLLQAWTPHGQRLQLFVLLCLMIAMALVSLSVGTLPISISQSLAILLSFTGLFDGIVYDPAQELVLEAIRAPRVLLAMLVGASLAVSGAVIQGLFRNPLADPALIGVSSGAAVSAAIVIVLGNVLFGELPQLTHAVALPVAAFAGGVITTLLVYRFATVSGTTDVATMLLAGIAITAIASAGLGLMIFLADDVQLRTLTFWTLGSFSGTTWPQLLLALPYMLLPILILPVFAGFLNAMLLGEAEAGHLGYEIQRNKLALILLVALAVGAAVSLAGIVGFIGLLVPHLVRLASGPDHRFLVPAAALLGATLMMLADLLARTIVTPAEMPIGIITALIGGPFFLWLLGKYRARLRF